MTRVTDPVTDHSRDVTPEPQRPIGCASNDELADRQTVRPLELTDARRRLVSSM